MSCRLNDDSVKERVSGHTRNLRIMTLCFLSFINRHGNGATAVAKHEEITSGGIGQGRNRQLVSCPPSSSGSTLSDVQGVGVERSNVSLNNNKKCQRHTSAKKQSTDTNEQVFVLNVAQATTAST